jgi:hypothetical protein
MQTKTLRLRNKARKGRSMKSSEVIHVVSYYAVGEVGDVIVGGVAPPPGKTV